MKEGLIPPPEGAGRGARYGWHHVHALKLICRLKAETHLRLEGIGEILEQMTPDDMALWTVQIDKGLRTPAELVAKFTVASTRDEGIAMMLRDVSHSPDAQRAPLGTEAGAVFGDADHAAQGPGVPAGADGELNRLLDEADAVKMERRTGDGPGEPSTSETEAAETWKRIRLADDVEIQVRADVSDERRQQLELIIQMARETLDA